MSPSPELRSSIRRFIESNYMLGEANRLADADSLLESQVMDSTGVLELVSFLESSYEVQVADEELIPENLDSIDRIAEFVHRKQSKHSM